MMMFIRQKKNNCIQLDGCNDDERQFKRKKSSLLAIVVFVYPGAAHARTFLVRSPEFLLGFQKYFHR